MPSRFCHFGMFCTLSSLAFSAQAGFELESRKWLWKGVLHSLETFSSWRYFFDMRCYDLLASNNLIGGSATSQTWNCMRASLNFSRAPMFASWVLIITFVSIFVCVVSISLNVRCFVYNVHSCYFMCDSLGIYI